MRVEEMEPTGLFLEYMDFKRAVGKVVPVKNVWSFAGFAMCELRPGAKYDSQRLRLGDLGIGVENE